MYIFKLRKCTMLNKYNIFRFTHGLTLNNIRKEKVNEIFPQKHEFQIRHIGPRQYEQLEMLKTIGYKNLEELTKAAIPAKIFYKEKLKIEQPISK